MANGIPPFLPATPPPMCELDFYEDEDDDDFGDFSNASECCYHDNATISKINGDNALNDAEHVFDPGTLSETTPNHHQSLKNDLFPNSIKDNSFGDFAHHHETISVSSEPHQELPVQSETSLGINISDSLEKSEINVSDSLEKLEINELGNCKENSIPLDSMKKNDEFFNTVVANCSSVEVGLSLTDDDSSIGNSISDNCDEKLSKNGYDISINLGNGLEDDSNFSNVINDSIKEESSLKINSTQAITSNLNGFAEPDSDFTSFFSSSEANQNNELDSSDDPLKFNFEKTEENFSQRTASIDSDDSNVPDIDFNCFITGSNELGNEKKFEDDDFGDFIEPAELDAFNEVSDEHFPTSLPNPPSALTDNFELNNEFRPHNLESTIKVTNDQLVIEEELENAIDDDFSDFVSTTCPPPSDHCVQLKETHITETYDDFEPFSDYYSKAENFQSSVPKQSPFQDGVKPHSSTELEKMYDLSAECWSEAFQVSTEEQIEVNVNTLEGKLKGSSVWCKIKDIESSPALSYNWNNSETQKVLLAALYVDSRNILFGPRWNSEVPRFASNLGFSPLVPQKAPETKDAPPIENFPKPVVQDDHLFVKDNIPSSVPTSVPEAHFDWNNSGLTNPLDSYSHSSLLDLDLLASFDIHSPYYKKNRKSERAKDSSNRNPTSYENSLFAKTPHRQEPSEEAKEVLKNLPNLYVMEKQYIVFPVS